MYVMAKLNSVHIVFDYSYQREYGGIFLPPLDVFSALRTLDDYIQGAWIIRPELTLPTVCSCMHYLSIAMSNKGNRKIIKYRYLFQKTVIHTSYMYVTTKSCRCMSLNILTLHCLRRLRQLQILPFSQKFRLKTNLARCECVPVSQQQLALLLHEAWRRQYSCYSVSFTARRHRSSSSS